MADWVQADACPICSSPIFAKLVQAHEQPVMKASCRCRVVYPDRFKVAGQLGYGKTGFAGIRR